MAREYAEALPRDRAIGAYVEPFLRHCEGPRALSPATVTAYASALRSFVTYIDTLGVGWLDDIKPRTIEGYLAWLRASGLAARTANQHRSALGGFWRFLCREEVATRNPVTPTYALREARGMPDFLDYSEQERVLTHLSRARRWSDWQAFAIVCTGLLAGLRAAEIAALQLDHLHLDAGFLRVINGKGQKSRVVAVVPWYVERMRLWLAIRATAPRAAGSPYVFVARGAPLVPMATRVIYFIVNRTVGPLIGRRCHPHALRHSFATRLLGLRVDLETIRRAMGHANLATTQQYLHISDAVTSQRMAPWLAGAAEEVPPLPHLQPSALATRIVVVSDLESASADSAAPPSAGRRRPPGGMPHIFADPNDRADLERARRHQERIREAMRNPRGDWRAELRALRRRGRRKAPRPAALRIGGEA